ncbi:MAG: redoxin domain-containing protein [Candidatus Hydrogenedentes bacterium]|nr:redoxin domain-containing protein [Candidatus Hydrogenedentota bacterium]
MMGLIQLTAQLSVVALTTLMAFEGVREGDAVPAFSLKSTDGQSFDSTKEFNAPASIIAFCRLEQEYSEALLKDLQGLYSEVQSKGVRVAAIFSGDADPAKVAELKKRLDIQFPLLLDSDRATYGKFGVIVAPATGFVDGKGVLRFYYANYRRDFPDTARANVDLLLGKISESERADRTKPKAAPEANSSRAGAHYRLGLQLLKAGMREEAEKELNQAWNSEPRSADAGIELGLVLLQENKNEEALKALTDAAKLAPDSAKAGGARGVALLRTGKEDEGKALLEQAIGQSVKTPLLYFEMGLWYEKHGMADKAAASYRKGLEIALEGS